MRSYLRLYSECHLGLTPRLECRTGLRPRYQGGMLPWATLRYGKRYLGLFRDWTATSGCFQDYGTALGHIKVLLTKCCLGYFQDIIGKCRLGCIEVNVALGQIQTTMSHWAQSRFNVALGQIKIQCCIGPNQDLIIILGYSQDYDAALGQTEMIVKECCLGLLSEIRTLRWAIPRL